MKKSKKKTNRSLNLLLSLLSLYKEIIRYQQDKIKRFQLAISVLIVSLVLIIAYFKWIGG